MPDAMQWLLFRFLRKKAKRALPDKLREQVAGPCVALGHDFANRQLRAGSSRFACGIAELICTSPDSGDPFGGLRTAPTPRISIACRIPGAATKLAALLGNLRKAAYKVVWSRESFQLILPTRKTKNAPKSRVNCRIAATVRASRFRAKLIGDSDAKSERARGI